MSLGSRLANVFRSDRLNREIAEEMESHIAEAVEQGRDPAEARRALGAIHQQRRYTQEGHDIRAIPWLESLRADVIFGWRQLRKRKVTTAAAVLSLALATGACTSAFRLVDALFLQPLPISDPGSLYAVHFDGFSLQGEPAAWDTTSYPAFTKMREAVKGQAELIAIQPAQHAHLTYGSEQEYENTYVQHVSGWMFPSFGVQPAMGRLFTEDDDRVPGAKPYAVLSYAYWTSRFGRDPRVVGRTFLFEGRVYQIIGVSEERFTGTEPGTIPEIFVPTMMFGAVNDPGEGWLRIFVRLYPGAVASTVQDRMYATYRAHEQERAKSWMNFPKELLVGYPKEKLLLKPARSGVSELQQEYSRALMALAALVSMVLLIACTNVANLMTAQAASRAREMALRVSLGAGRLRLVQMVLVESAMLATLSALLGGAFAWWSAPFVVSRINPPDNPARLILPADWRVFGFGLLLTLAVTLLFGLTPALRASSVQPVNALKGGDGRRSRRSTIRTAIHSSIALQVAFCFVVLFLAGLFVQTFEHLSARPLGFDAEGILALNVVSPQKLPAVKWDQINEQLKSAPGVEAVSLSSWSLLSGQVENALISINSAPPSNALARFLSTGPGWIGTMKIPLLSGRDFRDGDSYPHVAVVNQQFAKQYFGGVNPVGKFFEVAPSLPGRHDRIEVVGLVANAAYKDVHDAMLPVAYLPIHQLDSAGALQPLTGATFTLRVASGDASALTPMLKEKITHLQPELQINTVRTQIELVHGQTIRERLLAMLALFFAGIALLLAAIGLYGVLNYSVVQREREIGIRLALGSGVGKVAQLVTSQVLLMVIVGAVAGSVLGIASVRFVQALLFEVRGNDPAMLVLPALVLLGAALLAAMPAMIRAARINPALMLRAE